MKHRQDTGSALVMAVFVLALISSMGVALLFMSTNEVRSSEADMRSKQVYYLAEAGMEAGRATLLILNGAGSFTDDLTTYAGVNVALDFDPDALQATYDTDGNVTGLTGYGDDVPLISATAFGDGWYAAFMTNDAINGTSPTDTNDRVVITGVGLDSNSSVEIVQAVVTREVIIPPAAITLLGPTPSFSGGHSNPKLYVGTDCDGVGGVPGLNVPLVGVIGPTAEALVEAGIGTDPAYTSGGYTGEDTFADLTDPTEPTYNDPLDSVWTNCQELHDKVEQIRLIADVVCTDGNSCVLPPSSPDRIIFVDDDYGLNTDGEGLILVTGDFTTNGGVMWSGMMWAIGTGDFRRNGGGAATVDGSILAANIAGPDGIYGNADDCTGGVGGFGPATFDENGGGNGQTTYCTDDIFNASPAYPYELVEFRQM
jgi:hypothetical protein